MKVDKWIETHVPSLENKTYVVTGANSGLGFETTRILASKGAHVFMACRSEERANTAIEKIRKETQNAKLTFIKYDQADFAKITSFVENLAKLNLNIDGFVINAGVYFPPKGARTAQGFPLTIGVNFVGAYYLIRELIAHNIFKDYPTRLVIVGSVASKNKYSKHFASWFKEEKVNRNLQYYHSKGALELLTVHLMNDDLCSCPKMKLPSNVRVYYAHPGITKSNIVRVRKGGFGRTFVRMGQNFLSVMFHSTRKASLSLVAALVTESDGKNVSFGPRGIFAFNGFPKKRKMKQKSNKKIPEFMAIVEEEVNKVSN